MVVCPGTSLIHSHTFAKALGAEVIEDLTKIPDNERWIFWVGIDPSCQEKVKSLRAKGHKVAGYWIGSDSWASISDKQYRKQIPEFDAHIAVHERIQSELQSWGVESEVVYPCARNYYPAHEVPPRKNEGRRVVGIYSPTPGPEDLYMHDECVQVAKENPDLQFIFYGAPGYKDLPSNCEDSGRMTPEDMQDLYSKFSCILRLCRHDGFPVGGIEAKIRNLHVIENYPYNGFKYAESLEEVTDLLQQGETHEEDRGPWPAWFREVGAPTYFARRINSILR